MRIGLIGTEASEGGAARAMQRTIAALKAAGHETVVISMASGDCREGTAIRVQDRTVGHKSRRAGVAHYFYNGRYVAQNRTGLSNTLFWVPTVGLDLAELVGRLNLDLVNVHWASYFLSLVSLEQLMALPTPVVFTLHDMAHFTGGCHYAAGCKGFEAECRPCPQLRWDPLSVPRDVRRSRARVYKKGLPWAIAPSRWMAGMAKDGGLFAPGRIHHVPNTLDTDRFSPRPRRAARQAFGLAPDARVILFGAVDNREHRKGFDLLVATMRDVVARADGPITAMCFGGYPPGLDVPGLQVVETGYIDSDERLVAAYCAADVTIIPSREDNLPNVMLESLSCGTPVAAFSVGGLGETIQQGVNGALAPPEDTSSLADAVLAVLEGGEGMRQAARLSAVRLCEPSWHASRYVEVFEAARAAANLPLVPDPSAMPDACGQMAVQYRPANLEIFGGYPAGILISLRALLAEFMVGLRALRALALTCLRELKR